MQQKRLQKGSTLADISAKTMNRVFDLVKEDPSVRDDRKVLPFSGQTVSGRNDCGHDLEIGAGVILHERTAELTPWGNWRNGWYQFHPIYWPIDTTELDALVGPVWRCGVAIDRILDGEHGKVAMSGIVEVIATYDGEPCVRPHLKTADFATEFMGDEFGFKVIAGTESGAIINLDCWHQPHLYGLTTAAIAANAWGTATVDGRSYPFRNVGGALANGANVVLMPSTNHYRGMRYC